MLELGNTAPATDLIKDVNEDTFMQDVVEASKDIPVIVDFWAPWCGPCKTLGPALEAEVQAAGGKVKMVKIDIDQNQMIASQMRVQSIPAVFAFVDGQPVDGFMGAKAPSEIKDFIAKVIAANGGGDDGGLEEAVKMAEEMMEQGAVVDAAETFAAILGEEPENVGAYAGLISAHLTLGDADKATALVQAVPDAIANDPAILAVKAKLELAALAQDAGEAAELRAQLETKPNDPQTLYDLAMAELAAGNSQQAIDTLLDLFKVDQDWNDGAAKEQLFKIFDSLGAQDEIAQTGRRKLSSIIFA